MDKSDENLVREYLDGDEEPFHFLIERYTDLIYNFVFRFAGKDNASDIVQDVLIKAWRHIKSFDIKKASFKTWIFTIARNTTTDYLRKRKMVVFSSLDKEEEIFADNIEDDVILPDEALIKLEDKEFLNSLLDKLPAHYKEVLVLYYQEEMTFNEIGQLLKKPLNTVKSYHHRALILLREMVH